VKPLGLDIWHGIDCPVTCETESYMLKLTFTRSCLSDIIVIMAIMHVPLVELICQAMMRWIPALEYVLPGMRVPCGHVLSYQVVNVAASRDLDAW
jgi:hypothetical protein